MPPPIVGRADCSVGGLGARFSHSGERFPLRRITSAGVIDSSKRCRSGASSARNTPPSVLAKIGHK